MVYKTSGAENQHFCDLLMRIEDHINTIINYFFNQKCNTELLWACQVYQWYEQKGDFCGENVKNNSNRHEK